MKITNTNGDVHLSTSVPPTYPIEVNLGKGEIALDIPPASNFQIEASSRHGEVNSDFPSLSVNKEGDTPSINGTNGKGGPVIRLSTSYGTIRLGHEEVSPPSAPPAPRAPHSPTSREKVFFRRWQMPRRHFTPVDWHVTRVPN